MTTVRQLSASIPARDAAKERMRSALLECETYFEDRADIANDHDEDGSPRPNKEMSLLTEIRMALEER